MDRTWFLHHHGCTRSLNPYSNGIWIEQIGASIVPLYNGLNPYSNGIWIEHVESNDKAVAIQVLILILMEYG